MQFEERLNEIQAALRECKMDGWLLFDYRQSNPAARTMLAVPLEKITTRRFFYWIPKEGQPIKIVPQIEPYTLDHLPGLKWLYRGWKDLEQLLFSLLVANSTIAMEYSPYNALPNIAKVDAGFIDLLRKWGVQVVSSANILQRYTSVWTKEQINSHRFAANVLEQIVDRTWAFIEHSLQNRLPINEYQVQQFMVREMEEANCETSHWPDCAVNAHSADPHYEPSPDSSSPIRVSDFILIDIWCKQKIPHAVYADITRVGVAATVPTAKQQEIFTLVKMARDAATLFVKENYENQRPVQGWEVDDVARKCIAQSGYGEYFIHRTGHNLGEEVHGAGANIDNFETHDYRELLPGTAFTIEPGIYLPGEFGVRLEYDLYLNPAGTVEITGGIQKELVCLQVVN